MKKIPMTKAMKDYLKANSNAVICFETGVMYPSAHAAAKQMDLPRSSVNAYVRQMRASPINGYTFEYLNRLKGRRF